MSEQKFFEMARKRYQIMLDKNAGKPKPWTNDKIFQSFRFCNVFREDDKVTAWIRENVREPYADSPKLMQAIVIARWFNKIETLEVLKEHDLFVNWSHATAQQVLKNCHPLVTGAYIIKTPDGVNKLEGVLWCIHRAIPEVNRMQSEMTELTTLELTVEALARLPFLGNFMAYEIVTDLRHTKLLNKASDIMTWANPGPGCRRGLARILGHEVTYFQSGGKRTIEALNVHMQSLLRASQMNEFWPSNWPQWEMRDVEHGLCEFDKYQRVSLGEGRPKQLYKGM